MEKQRDKHWHAREYPNCKTFSILNSQRGNHFWFDDFHENNPGNNPFGSWNQYEKKGRKKEQIPFLIAWQVDLGGMNEWILLYRSSAENRSIY